jgi:hypothetical protein
MTLIKDKIDALFLEVRLQPNGGCDNPITGGRFMKGESGEDSMPYQKARGREGATGTGVVRCPWPAECPSSSIDPLGVG